MSKVLKSNGNPSEWAAIFDWDGVLIDSSSFHRRSWDILAARHALTLPDRHFERGFGRRNVEIIPDLLGWSNDLQEIEALSREKETIYRELIIKARIAPVPGVLTWLDQLVTHDVPRAIGSSTPRRNIDCVLALWGWVELFPVVVTAEDVSRGKPDPEVFQKAAMRMDMRADRCVIFEDSPMGIEAARAGGMRAVAVVGTHPAETFPDVDQVVSQLDECRVESMERWFAAP